jgi:hypothetical protein
MSAYVSRKGHRQTGWRLPRSLVEEVRAVCKAKGIRPGTFVTETLRKHFGETREYTAASLAKIVKYPPHLQTSKERLESAHGSRK